jgi:hypothetical protein
MYSGSKTAGPSPMVLGKMYARGGVSRGVSRGGVSRGGSGG